MFLHDLHFLSYDTFTFYPYQRNAPFWLPKSIKIDPQTYQNWYWFFYGFFEWFLFNFGSISGGLWEALGLILAPKTGEEFVGIAIRFPLVIILALDTSFDPLMKPKNPSTTVSIDKTRYGMTLRASIHRFLSIGLALARPHFLRLSSPFLIVRAKSCFRIAKYDTKSTSTVYACMHAVFWILSILKVIEVEFVSISIDRIGRRLEGTFTIYRKMRYEMRVPMPKYRFLSIGLALRKSNFLVPSGTCSTFHLFVLDFWFLWCFLSLVSCLCLLSLVFCLLFLVSCLLSLSVPDGCRSSDLTGKSVGYCVGGIY